MNRSQFKRGDVYEIDHARKGKFVALILGIVDADEGDEADDYFLYIRYDVRAGTDQARLQTTGSKQRYRESNIRPSLITKIEKFEGDTWLRDMPLPPEPEPVPSGFDRLRKSIFGGN